MTGLLLDENVSVTIGKQLRAHNPALRVYRIGDGIALPPDVAHQAGHVLRLRPGDRIVLLDGSGDECEVELIAFGRSAIRGRVVARRAAPEEQGPRVTLYQCVLKGEKFGWVLQKAT